MTDSSTVTRVYGDGHCAVCDKTCGTDMLMCRTHWYEVPQLLRTKVWEAVTLWHAGSLTLAQLREVQDKAIASVTRHE